MRASAVVSQGGGADRCESSGWEASCSMVSAGLLCLRAACRAMVALIRLLLADWVVHRRYTGCVGSERPPQERY